jgi:hypothetical protein
MAFSLTEDEQRDLEHLRVLLESQAKQIENLKRLLKESGDRVDRHVRRNFELRAELAKYVRPDNPVLRGKKK